MACQSWRCQKFPLVDSVRDYDREHIPNVVSLVDIRFSMYEDEDENIWPASGFWKCTEVNMTVTGQETWKIFIHIVEQAPRL